MIHVIFYCDECDRKFQEEKLDAVDCRDFDWFFREDLAKIVKQNEILCEKCSEKNTRIQEEGFYEENWHA